jgi:hypothetical protein
MKFILHFVGCVMLTFAGFCTSAQHETCTLKKDKDGIKVYACHSDTAQLKSVRAEVLLENTTLELLKAHILDIENYVTWQYKMLKADVLESVSDSEVIMRTVVDTPWPASNREVISQLMAKENALGVLEITGKVIPYDYPPEKGLVRVPFSESAWTVTEINGTDLKVQYVLRVNPGGSLPVWLINLAVAEGPYQSFRNLKAQLIGTVPADR